MFIVRIWVACGNPGDKTRWPTAGVMLVHRLRRWTNIIPAVGRRLVSAVKRFGNFS